MTRDEHQEAYDTYSRRLAELRTERVLTVIVAIARGVLHALVAGAVVTALGWLCLANGCGDLEAQPAADAPVQEPAPTPPAPAAPDAEAFALAARMRAWQPTWREHAPGELEAVATAIVTACRRDPWPDASRCPDLIAAIAFRESSFRHGAIGARGERGLMQLLPGVATGGESAEAAMDLDVNVRLGLAHLRRAQTMCRFVGRGDVSTALGMYGSGRCRAYRGSRLVERWATEIAAVTP